MSRNVSWPSRGGAVAVPATPGAAKRATPPTKSLKLRLLAVALAVAAVVAVLKLTGALDYLSFGALARNREWLVGEVEALGFGAALVFMLVYAVSTALSLPTGTPRTSRAAMGGM